MKIKKNSIIFLKKIYIKRSFLSDKKKELNLMNNFRDKNSNI